MPNSAFISVGPSAQSEPDLDKGKKKHKPTFERVTLDINQLPSTSASSSSIGFTIAPALSGFDSSTTELPWAFLYNRRASFFRPFVIVPLSASRKFYCT